MLRSRILLFKKGEGLPKQYQNQDLEYEEIAERAGRNMLAMFLNFPPGSPI